MVRVYGEVGPMKSIKYALKQGGMHINTIEDYVSLEAKLCKEDSLLKQTALERYKRLLEENQYEGESLNNTLGEIQIQDVKKYSLYNFIRASKKILLECRKKKNLYTRNKLLCNKKKNLDRFENSLKKELFFKKHILEEQKNNYYGAIAELEVQSHIQHIHIDSIIINDYTQSFTRAIPMKGGGDWIQTIQIDHIIINKKGIFLIETKNWSKEFESKETFTPAYQAKRHGHGFYFGLKDVFEREVGFMPKSYNIVAKKQYCSKKYHSNLHVSEMHISELNSFICSRKDELTRDHIENIIKVLT